MDRLGAVSGLARFPVKSMAGEQPESIELTAHGVVGDRAYALVDVETGKVVTAKDPRKWAQMLHCRAEFVDSPAADSPPPPVRITLADGTVVMTDAADADDALSSFFGRDVTLSSAAPEQFVIDHYQPDVEAEARFPGTDADSVNNQALGASLWAELGMPPAVPEGSFLDMFPVSVLTSSTLRRLADEAPDTMFDARRFRMNVVVDTIEPGFVENGWLGQELQIGDECRVAVMLPDPRCVMTTLAQEDLPRDKAVLQALARHNRLELAGAGMFPCAGVYAVVTEPGVIRVGADVVLR